MLIVLSVITEMPSIFFISAARPEAKGMEAVWAESISCQPVRSAPMSLVIHITWSIEPPIGIETDTVYFVAFQSLIFWVSVVGVTVTFDIPPIWSMCAAI